MAGTAVAAKNLLRDKARLAISVGGVAVAVLLVLVVRGLYSGFLDQATEYIDGVGVEVWVAEEGTSGDLFHSVSLMDRGQGEEIAAVEGVSAVHPLVVRSVRLEHDAGEVEIFLLGVAENGVGGPVEMVEGAPAERPGELVIDRVLSADSGLGVGDTLSAGEHDWQVSGIASGGHAFIADYGWVPEADLLDFYGIDDLVSFYLVSSAADTSAEDLANRISSEVAGTNAMTERDFIAANTEEVAESFLPIIWVLVIIAFVIGTAVIALTIYTATVEKRSEFGVMKAIGFSNRRLFGIVWRQALVAGGLGMVVGTVATFLLAAVVERVMPSFVVSLTAGDIAFVGLVTLAMSVLASMVPIRPVARLDPAEVFRV